MRRAKDVRGLSLKSQVRRCHWLVSGGHFLPFVRAKNEDPFIVCDRQPRPLLADFVPDRFYGTLSRPIFQLCQFVQHVDEMLFHRVISIYGKTSCRSQFFPFKCALVLLVTIFLAGLSDYRSVQE